MRAGAFGGKDAAIVDLDRDSIFELIKLQRSKLSIHTRSSNAVAWNKTPAYSLALSFGESLAIGDFNGDQLDDVLMVAKKGGGVGDNSDYLLLQQPGFSFASINLGRTAGSGDDVGTVDYNRDGLADFVVSNGDMQKAGPVQLWTNQVVPLP